MAQQDLIPGIFQTQATPMREPITFTEARPQFPLDYKGRNHVYVFSNGPFVLTATGYATISYVSNTWLNVPFPQTTVITHSAEFLLIACTDMPIQDPTIFRPRRINQALTLNRQDVGSAWSSGQISGTEWSELAIDFTVYAITGGTAPTVTFLVSRLGLDGVLYKLEEAMALSAPGAISYSIGAGLDGKSFMGIFQVDMVVTGAPTNVNLSGSIKMKQ